MKKGLANLAMDNANQLPLLPGNQVHQSWPLLTDGFRAETGLALDLEPL
jgi:hypothetical protein